MSMTDPQATQFERIYKRIINHTVHTLLFLFVLLLVIAISRAAFVIYNLQQAAEEQPINLDLTAAWSPLYPSLYSTFTALQLDEQITVTRPPAWERFLLAVPNVLVNLTLNQTQSRWKPDIGTSADSAPSPQDTEEVEETQPTPSPSETTAPPDTAIEPKTTEPSEPETEWTSEPDDASPDEQDEDFDPDARWAAVITPNAPIFDTDGERQEQIDPGSVFEILEERTSGEEPVFIGTVHTPRGIYENIVIRKQDLQIYQGKTLHETSQGERERASEIARIEGDIAIRKQELEAEYQNQNPHQEPYRTALQRYRTLRDQAREIRDIYDDSTGSTRVNAGSRLREIRQEMQSLTPQIRELEGQRDLWEQNNDRGPAPDPDQDPQIRELRREQAELKNRQSE